MSVREAVRSFGDPATQACMAELKQLFLEKKALVPVKWSELTHKQKRNMIRSHMFLKKKYKDGQFIKIKALLVADGRMQDCNAYTNCSSPPVKTSSVMTCLKLADRHRRSLPMRKHEQRLSIHDVG